LVLLFAALHWVDLVFSEQPDLANAARVMRDLGAHGADGDVLVHFLVAFALGTGLLVRDLEDGTLAFLDGLPTTRHRIFVVKVLVAALLLSLLPLSLGAATLAKAALSRTSLRPTLPLAAVATGVALHLVQVWAFLSIGVLLSFLRRFTWIGMGIAYWSYELLSARAPALALFNPFFLTRPVYRGDRWLVSGRELAANLALIALALSIAGFLFARAGDRLFGAGRGAVRTRRFASGLLVALTVGLGASVAARVLSPTEDEGQVHYSGFGTARARTARYVVSYPMNLGARTALLLSEADATHDRVRAFLGLPESASTTIAVDASGSHQGTAGTAGGTKIRLDLSTLDEPAALAATLGHETVHVYVDRLSARRAGRAGRFFHEGLATHVEYALFRAPEELRKLRAIAGALHARQLARFEDLLDDQRLREQQDADVVYPLGEAFFEALIAVEGGGAPAAVLRALGREEARQDLRGLELLRDGFQAAGFDLDTVVGAYYRLLEEARRYRTPMTTLPRLFGSVSTPEGRVRVELPSLMMPEGLVLACRFRLRKDSPVEDYTVLAMPDMQACDVSRRSVGASLEYQLGVEERGSNRALWEPWVEAPLE
jgi:hypothetical protein